MNLRVLRSLLMARYGSWIMLLVLPLVVNGLLWGGLVLPQRAKLQAWRDTQVLTELKPQLEGLLGESHRMLIDWERTSFTAEDPSTVMQTIQRLADMHHVDVKEISTPGQRVGAEAQHPVAGFTSLPLELEVWGPFSKLARWMSDVERQSGLQVESWTITAAKEPGQPHQLSVKLIALLKGTS